MKDIFSKNGNAVSDLSLFDPFKNKNKNTISVEVFDLIKSKILSGELKKGARIPTELQLCEHLGVGRSTLREAFTALSAIGLLNRTKRGTFVTDKELQYLIPFKDIVKTVKLNEIMEYRLLLEVEIASLAAKRATADNIEALKNFFTKMVECKDDLEEVTKMDSLFHLELAMASQNELLKNTLFIVKKELESLIYNAFERDPKMIDKAISFHKIILEAIIAEDHEKAARIMKEHIQNVYNIIVPK